jgi:2-C-methyl-D-erythritol 2,4-cyclodiphosphate synthase
VVRIGFGSDSHRFDPSSTRPLILGGVKISDSGGLVANSDGDVVLHALFNALSQACGGDSIGVYADPMLSRGISDSAEYLKASMDMVAARGCRVNNIGIMVEAQRPRIPLETVRRMRERIARLTGVSEGDVGITFTSGEGLSAFGRGEGILVQTVVSLVPVEFTPHDANHGE